MAAEAPRAPSLIRSRPTRNPASRRQIEAVLSRSLALFAALFALQALPIAIDEWSALQLPWSVVLLGVSYAAIAVLVVTALAGLPIRAVGGALVVTWYAVMALWPVAATGDVMVEHRPWPWFLCTVATVAAAVVWPIWASTVVLLTAPLLYAVVRISPMGGSTSGPVVAVDVLQTLILGGAALVIIHLLRDAAAAVDAAQAAALDQYSIAVGQQATEDERVQVDAIVHDSILAALLSAARAETPEARRLAAKMAADAIASLQDSAVAPPDGEPVVTIPELERRIRAAVDRVAPAFDYRVTTVGSATIPARAARAVQAATVQSMVNSAQHAGATDAVERWVSVAGSATGGIVVEIGDTGRGFDPRSLPASRMGLRVSVVERVTNAGGRVSVESSPGEGAVVTIEWPAADNPARLPHATPGTRTVSGGVPT